MHAMIFWSLVEAEREVKIIKNKEISWKDFYSIFEKLYLYINKKLDEYIAISIYVSTESGKTF